MKTYQKIASTLQALANCRNHGNKDWSDRHEEALAAIMRETAPRGSGIDCGTKFDINDHLIKDKKGRLVTRDYLRFITSFHHMDEHGCYDGWTDHTITIHPDFVFGYTMTISGKDRNDIKDYLAEEFSAWLDSDAS